MPSGFFANIIYGDMKYYGPASANNSIAIQVASTSAIQSYIAESITTNFEWLVIGT